jgi:hypothetical protein
MRARDSGLGVLVYWFTQDPTATPSASITIPNYTGVLGAFTVVFSVLTCDDEPTEQTSGGIKVQNFVPIPNVMNRWPVAIGPQPTSDMGANRLVWNVQNYTTYETAQMPMFKSFGSGSFINGVWETGGSLQKNYFSVQSFKVAFNPETDSLVFSGTAVQVV